MGRPKSVVLKAALDIVLNVVVLAIAPLLVIAWLVRVHTIEYRQRRRSRLARANPQTAGARPIAWTMFHRH